MISDIERRLPISLLLLRFSLGLEMMVRVFDKFLNLIALFLLRHEDRIGSLGVGKNETKAAEAAS